MMAKHLIGDFSTIILSLITIFFVYISSGRDLITTIFVFGGLILIIIFNSINIYLQIKNNAFNRRVDIYSLISVFITIFGFLLGEMLSASIKYKYFHDALTSIVFGYYFFISFLLVFNLTISMYKIENSTVLVLSVVVLIVAIGARFLVILIDLVFPPRLQELVPYIAVTREMIYNIAQIMADPDRLKAEAALNSISDVNESMNEIAEGYALRKGIGQSIDSGLTAIVFLSFGVVGYLQIVIGLPPYLIAALLSSLSLALSTFAGFFGPFYGLSKACKEFTLKNGNYRGATFYKVFQQLFAIPFKAASAGFLLLDFPPIDADSLEDFKGEIQEQLTEITESMVALVGKDKSAVPKKTRRMIASLMNNSEESLAKLDFRNIRKDVAREFALTYYQHEFSLRPWKRKDAVKEFAEMNHFDLLTAEETLKLIGYKIKAGQMDDDMVNNVMISASMKGVIMLEQKFMELFEDTELGQTCTGLAFGARQFLNDHYVVKSRFRNIFDTIKNFFVGVFAIPIVLILAYHSYANRAFDFLIENINEGIFENRIVEVTKMRWGEIKSHMYNIFTGQNKKEKEKKVKDKNKTQRNWQIQRKIKRLFSMIWEVIVFPLNVLLGIAKWGYKSMRPQTRSAREQFEETVSHAALVSMYSELYDKLVKQTPFLY